MTKVGHGGSGWRRDGEREREIEDSREDEEKTAVYNNNNF